jgi:hypothetical protein
MKKNKTPKYEYFIEVASFTLNCNFIISIQELKRYLSEQQNLIDAPWDYGNIERRQIAASAGYS